jgi:hypothetical protein
MERLGLLLHRASDGRLAPHFGAGPFSWPLLENPQSCDQGHTTARRRAVSGGLGELSPPRAEALCGRRHAWGVPLFTLHFSPDFFSCVAVFAGGADRLATAAAATPAAWRCWRRRAGLQSTLKNGLLYPTRAGIVIKSCQRDVPTSILHILIDGSRSCRRQAITSTFNFWSASAVGRSLIDCAQPC